MTWIVPFSLDPDDDAGWRATVLDAAARLGLAVEHLDRRQFRVVCPSAAQCYEFGVASGLARRESERPKAAP